MTPMAQGVADRPDPGAFLTHEILVKQLGVEDYGKLLRGDGVSWSDDRVRAALDYAKAIIDAGAFPPSLASIKLGEAHRYFHTQPGSVMFQMGSFYPSRAFLPPDEGGQPEGFPLGVVNSPIREMQPARNARPSRSAARSWSTRPASTPSWRLSS